MADYLLQPRQYPAPRLAGPQTEGVCKVLQQNGAAINALRKAVDDQGLAIKVLEKIIHEQAFAAKLHELGIASATTTKQLAEQASLIDHQAKALDDLRHDGAVFLAALGAFCFLLILVIRKARRAKPSPAPLPSTEEIIAALNRTRDRG
jgi:hypothetical protein